MRAELARRRLSQAKLGEALGISQTQISKRLLGRLPFDVDELHQAADFIGVPVSLLMMDHAVDQRLSSGAGGAVSTLCDTADDRGVAAAHGSTPAPDQAQAGAA